MIYRKLLNSRELKSIKDFKKEDKRILDIIIYGSYSRGKLNFRDIDIAVILGDKTDVDYKLSIAQRLRSALKNVSYEADVKAIDLPDLMDETFLARQAIISEGYSLLKNKKFSDILGFKSYYIFYYSLKNLTNSEKMMLQYALRGRRGQKGIMELRNCELLGKGVMKVPTEYSEEIIELFERHKIAYKIYKGLFY